MSDTAERIQHVLRSYTIDGKPLDITNPRLHRLFTMIPREHLKPVAMLLAKQLNAAHISTITARDTGSELRILYHFFIDSHMVTVQTSCPRDDPTIDSIVDVFPGAILYEREIHDLLGIIPKKHPDLRRLVLPENWTQGHPLRKDWKPLGGEPVG